MTDLRERLHRAAPEPTRPLDVGTVQRGARHRTVRARVVTGVALGALLLVSGLVIAGLDRDDPETLDVVETPDPLAGEPADSWVRLLALVPDTPEIRASYLSILDVAHARADLGVDALPPASPDDEVGAQLEQVLGDSAGSIWPNSGATPSGLRAELGFGHQDVDQVVRVSPAPPGEIYVARGRFDPAAVEAAVESDPHWSDALERKTYRGVEYYSWGEDYGIERPSSPARSLGWGGRLVVRDDWLAFVGGDDKLQAIIDAYLDPQSSLASVDWMRRAVTAGDDAGLDAYVVRDTDLSARTGEAPDRRLPGPELDPPLGWSGGGTSQEPETQFVLAYATAEQAAANLDAYRAAWEGLSTSAPIAVRRDGTLLVATARNGTGHDAPVLEVELPDGTVVPVSPANFAALLNIRLPTLERPELPDPPPTQEEILADGVVSDDEYEVAFWTFVQCAEAGGVEFVRIGLEPDGHYGYAHTGGPAADACYDEHFLDVDRTWQVATED